MSYLETELSGKRAFALKVLRTVKWHSRGQHRTVRFPFGQERAGRSATCCRFISQKAVWTAECVESRSFPGGTGGRNLPPVQETQETQPWFPGLERFPGVGNGNLLLHFCRRSEERGGPQSMRSQRVRHSGERMHMFSFMKISLLSLLFSF